MNMRHWNIAVACIILVQLVACSPAGMAGSSGAASHGGPIRDHVTLVDHLRGLGFTVEIAGDVQQPFLRGRGTLLRVAGGDLQQPAEIQSYNYDDAELGTDGARAAQEDASAIGPDGNPRTAMIMWTAPPHFFRKERLIVLYVGDDPAVIKLLSGVLGAPFAGQ